MNKPVTAGHGRSTAGLRQVKLNKLIKTAGTAGKTPN